MSLPHRLAQAVVTRARRREARLLGALHGWRRRKLEATWKLQAMWNRSSVVLDIHPTARIGRGITAIVDPETTSVVRVGPGSRLGDRVLFRLKGGEAVIGPDCEVRRDVNLSVGGRLVLEGGNILSWATVVHCDDAITICKDASISEFCAIADSQHFITDPDVPFHHNLRTAPVVIGAGVWLASKVTVASGVTIGDHCIVGAGSTVLTDMPPGHLVGGVPARVIRSLDLPWHREVQPTDGEQR